jgi:predicted deacylase
MHKKTLSLHDLPGEPVDIPYAHFTGEAGDGPHLTVVAGVHGAEYTGQAAIMRLIHLIDERELSGELTLVPTLNQPAFWSRTPFVVPEDGKNLNRTFPGRPDGSYTELLAHAIFTTFIEPTDYLIDLHAGDIPEALQPFMLYEESDVEERSLALATSYGLPFVVRQSRATRTVGGSTSAAAADIGIPAIIAEVGANGICDDASVVAHLGGLLRVCVDLGMLTAERADALSAEVGGGEGPHAGREPRPLVHSDGWEWLRSPVKGWWQPAIRPGDKVATGDVLGRILDPYGDELHRVVAPAAGWPLFITSSPAVADDGLLLGLALES